MIQRIVDSYAYLFARKRFRRLNNLLCRMSLRGLGVANYQNHEISGEKHFLESRLKGAASPTVFDVGANVGNYSLDVLSVNPGARIFAFEPHPATFETLSKNVAGRGIQLTNAGCGSAAGEMVLYDYSAAGSEHASLYQGVIEDLHRQTARAHTIKIVDLDTFAGEHGIEQIDLLKIDTEGHELKVLEGASRLLRERRIQAIQFEFNEMNVISRTFFRDFYTILPEYDLYRTLCDGLLPLHEYAAVRCEIFSFQNVVALLKPSAK